MSEIRFEHYWWSFSFTPIRHSYLHSDDDDFCAVYLYRVPFSKRITITSCVPADSELFVDEVSNKIADDVDLAEEANWLDVALDALELMVVFVFILVIVTKKPTDGPADVESARDANPPSRPFNRRDTVYEISLDALRIWWYSLRCGLISSVFLRWISW